MEIKSLFDEQSGAYNLFYAKGNDIDLETFLRAVHEELVADHWSSRERQDYDEWKSRRVGNAKSPMERVKCCWMRWEMGWGFNFGRYGMVYDEKPAGNKGKGMFPVTTLELI